VAYEIADDAIRTIGVLHGVRQWPGSIGTNRTRSM
jgi:hypothetical protein